MNSGLTYEKPANSVWSRFSCELARRGVRRGLVEVHDKQLVGGRQLGRLVRELAIEVAHVLHRLLPQTQTSRYSTRSQRQHRCRPPANKIKNIDRLRASLSMPELKCDPRQK